MNLSARFEQLPVEDWAAAVARVIRRTRRRVMRRPARSAGALLAVVAIAAIGSNALWEQEGDHPAPIWGGGAEVADEGGARLVAAHSPATSTIDDAAGMNERDNLVVRVQSALVEAGYYGGEVDGHLSDETREAIQVFEVENGLPVSGEPSVALLAAFGELQAAAAQQEQETVEVASFTEVSEEVAAPVPQRPKTISSVTEIQAALNKVGFGPLTVDGVMGPRTLAALDQFAASRQLAAKGVTPAVLRVLAQEAH